MRVLIPAMLGLFLIHPVRGAVSADYRTARQARINGDYVMIVFADGAKGMVPLKSLKTEDRDWVVALSQSQPLPEGRSTVVVVDAAAARPARQTLVTATVEGPLETVQLCPPNIMRDQIGGTCMLYARIHWLDIAGYYLPTPEIYKIINGTPPDSPWTEPRYVNGLASVFAVHRPAPVRHRLPAHLDPFEWARGELRKGRPLLAAFPREIWQALPPSYVAEYPWRGGAVGHQIVINGFTWNRQTRRGTFHIINSWAGLREFDLTTDAAGGGALVIEESLSPFGEANAHAAPSAREVVKSVRLLKTVGAMNLYEVETDRDTRRMLAASEDAVRALVETP